LLHPIKKDHLAVVWSAEGEIWTPDQGLMSPLLYH
jgi:hypothetical protein